MSFIHANLISLNKPMKKWGKLKMAKTNRKHDRVIHYESAIQRMRFVSLYDVYRFLADVSGYAEDNGGRVSIEEMMSLYRPSPYAVEVTYDNDNSEKWGLSIASLQHVGVYKAPKETRFTQKSDYMSVNAVYGKGDGYYLVVRGVENMEALKNE